MGENQVKTRKITSLAELKQYKEGCIVELPPFGINQPFVAVLRRPSIMGLASEGKIPNALLETAEGLFSGKNSGSKSGAQILTEMKGVLDIVAKEALVNPSYDEIEEAGVKLSDDQLIAIFNYSQEGVKALKSFRR